MTTLSSGTAMAVVALALSRGLTKTEVEAVTGVSCLELLKPDSRPPENMMPKICAALAERFPGDPFALDMARAAPFSYFGGLADGAQFADDLRTAINLFVENSSIIADQLEIDFREDSLGARLISMHPMDHIDSGRSHEIGLGLVARLFTEFLGIDDCLERVTFRHDPNCDVAHYLDYFRVPVDFNAADMAIFFKPDKLGTRIKYANVDLFNYVQTHLSGIQKRINFNSEPTRLDLLRKAAAENVLSGVFGTAAVAAAANMSLRSAQRLTSENGTSLQELIDDVREQRAKELLREDGHSVTAISFILGYSDERAFRRAFSRWTGQSPSEFRSTKTKNK